MNDIESIARSCSHLVQLLKLIFHDKSARMFYISTVLMVIHFVLLEASIYATFKGLYTFDYLINYNNIKV